MFLQNGSLPKLVGRRPKVSSRNSIRELNVCQMGRAYCPILDSFSKLSWALSDVRNRQPSGLIHSRRHQTRSGTLRVPRSPLGICASSAIFFSRRSRIGQHNSGVRLSYCIILPVVSPVISPYWGRDRPRMQSKPADDRGISMKSTAYFLNAHPAPLPRQIHQRRSRLHPSSLRPGRTKSPSVTP